MSAPSGERRSGHISATVERGETAGGRRRHRGGARAHANHLLQTGRTGDARLELDEAAAIHRARGRVYDEARCTHGGDAVSLRRSSTKRRCDRASRCGWPIQRARLRCRPSPSSARSRWRRATAPRRRRRSVGARRRRRDRPGRFGARRCLRKRAWRLRRPDGSTTRSATCDGARSADSSRRLCGRDARADRAGHRPPARGPSGRRGRHRPTGDGSRRPGADHAALADLHLLLSARALDRHDAAAALASAETARTHALSANAPTPYVAAAHAIAQLAEAAGNRWRPTKRWPLAGLRSATCSVAT